MRKRIAILWHHGPIEGRLEASNAKLERIEIPTGKGKTSADRFSLPSGAPSRIEVSFADVQLSPGPDSTVVTVWSEENPFSFFLRDVDRAFPIFIPAYGVAVTEATDRRCFGEIRDDLASRSLRTKLEQIKDEPEQTYEEAASHTLDQMVPLWLGLGRDFRIFEVNFRHDNIGADLIHPRFHGSPVALPENENRPVYYNFFIGRGVGCTNEITRRLEDGFLPILHGTLTDEDICYHFTTFVTLESGKLTTDGVRGTHYLVADGYGAGHMFTKEQEAHFKALSERELHRDEETVIFFRIEALNTARVPRYAWFKAPHPAGWPSPKWEFDGRTGFGRYPSGRIFCVSTLDGRPLAQDEIAVLVEPGKAAVFEFRMPHEPISAARAAKLGKQCFEARHAECRQYWQRKLQTAASVNLPEKRLDEMVRAGLLHLDIVAYGLEPNGTVAPCIGVYCPIGSESAPIIQFMDSMGWHDLARRSLQYFLDKQHDDGFIQNFGGYMLETGAALWSMGEHYRYTRDDRWLRRIRPQLLKACDYMIAWRNRNKKEELRGRGYGMLDGKVADPEDPFHIFMLNGYAYMGMSRVAEMLAKLDPAESRRVGREAAALRNDIRACFFEVMSRSPVVPLGDGSWCPTAAPWAESRGPLCLFADKGRCFTHGTVVARDSMLGPTYLIFQEVLEPDELASDFLVNYHAELMHLRNAAFSQPYYSRHAWVHLARGEASAFLKTYYNTFSALADRQTYTFWEHFFHASPHKTHEEGWFLMETRWMLYMERGETLRLLPGVPRAWLEDGKRLELRNVASYFGPLSFRVESDLQHRRIVAEVKCDKNRRPKAVEFRLPHPEGRKAVRATGGSYDPEAEIVRIDDFAGRAEVVLEF